MVFRVAYYWRGWVGGCSVVARLSQLKIDHESRSERSAAAHRTYSSYSLYEKLPNVWALSACFPNIFGAKAGAGQPRPYRIMIGDYLIPWVMGQNQRCSFRRCLLSARSQPASVATTAVPVNNNSTSGGGWGYFFRGPILTVNGDGGTTTIVGLHL